MYAFDIDPDAPKAQLYDDLHSAAMALVEGEPDGIANMANVAALIWQFLPDLNWSGFYRMVEDELVLGPFVGKPAGLVPFPENCALVTILRDGQVYRPDPEQPIESGDELLFVVPAEIEEELERLLAPSEHGPRPAR